MTKIKDIYKGKNIDCWDDGDFITLAFPNGTTIAFPTEEWKDIKKDLEGIGNTK